MSTSTASRSTAVSSVLVNSPLFWMSNSIIVQTVSSHPARITVRADRQGSVSHSRHFYANTISEALMHGAAKLQSWTAVHDVACVGNASGKCILTSALACSSGTKLGIAEKLGKPGGRVIKQVLVSPSPALGRTVSIVWRHATVVFARHCETRLSLSERFNGPQHCATMMTLILNAGKELLDNHGARVNERKL